MKTTVKYLNLMPQIGALITECYIQWVEGLKDSKNWKVWNTQYFTQDKTQLHLPHVQTSVKLLNSTVTFRMFCLLFWGALVGWLLVWVPLCWKVSKIYSALWQWDYSKKLNHVSIRNAKRSSLGIYRTFHLHNTPLKRLQLILRVTNLLALVPQQNTVQVCNPKALMF